MNEKFNSMHAHVIFSCFCWCIVYTGFSKLTFSKHVWELKDSGRVIDLRLKGCRLEPHQGHCIVSLNKTH